MEILLSQLRVKAVRGESTYKVSYDFYGVTASKGESNVEAGTSFSVKLTANDGYNLKVQKFQLP